LGKDGKTVAKGDAAGQTRRCLEIIKIAVEELGAMEIVLNCLVESPQVVLSSGITILP
jgi:enamine deaminase RidA (YjgF/YER057c/UK114 family)